LDEHNVEVGHYGQVLLNFKSLLNKSD